VPQDKKYKSSDDSTVIGGRIVEQQWLPVLKRIRDRHQEDDDRDRDARRLEAIDSTMRLLLTQYGFGLSDEPTGYSFVIYFHKRRNDWEKDDKGKATIKVWNGDYDGPNFQHMWIEVVDAKEQSWVVEHFPGSRLTLSPDRQPVKEDVDYGFWSVNLAALTQEQVNMTEKLIDIAYRNR
jgi:hypothetical protein